MNSTNLHPRRGAWLALFLLIHGLTTALGQPAGRPADIKGTVVMPDGSLAKNVEIWVAQKKIVDTDLGFTGKKFWEKIQSDDGHFHVRFTRTVSVTIRAFKPGYRSNEILFQGSMKANGLVVQLIEVGEPVARGKLQRGSHEIEIKADVKAAGLTIKDMGWGGVPSEKQTVAVGDADFIFEWTKRRGDDGKETEGILFKARKGFGACSYPAEPKSNFGEMSYGDTFQIPPANGYEPIEFWLPFSLEDNGKRIRLFLQTPEKKFGRMTVSVSRQEKADKAEVVVRCGYLIQPDGSRNLDTWESPVTFDENGRGTD
jgi:hypothetical protein